MSIIYEPHACNAPDPNAHMFGFALAPIYEDGDVWQCEECGTWWRYSIPSYYGEWRRVRFWNLLTRHRIRKAAR